MWLIRHLLAKIGIRRKVMLHYNDDSIHPGVVVDEKRHHLAIRARVTLGFWQRPVVCWVEKDDPAVVGLHWPIYGKVIGVLAGIAVVIGLLAILPQPQWTDDSPDEITGLPIVATLYNQPLPDGHYTVSQTFASGALMVVQHKPGPYRDFVYLIMNRRLNNAPEKCAPGLCFTVFKGKAV
ncbi:MAG: hypothetical protein V1838_05940 [Patescibacteria group bacterium]